MRAIAITLVIAIGLVDGCPLPPAAYVEPWQVPIVDALRPIQEVVMRPFAWVTRALRFSQRWALFQVARRDRYRLELQGRAGGVWSVMFRAGDAEHTAYAELLLDERIRGAWNPMDRMVGQYGGLATIKLAHGSAGKALSKSVSMNSTRRIRATKSVSPASRVRRTSPRSTLRQTPVSAPRLAADISARGALTLNPEVWRLYIPLGSTSDVNSKNLWGITERPD